MASDRILSILGLIGDQMFKEKDVPVIDKSRYVTNGQASINPVNEYIYGEMPGTPLRGTQFSGMAQQYGDRDLRVNPIRPATVPTNSPSLEVPKGNGLTTAPMSRELEQNTMEQDIIDRASLLNMPYQPMSEFDRAEYENARMFSEGGFAPTIANPYKVDAGVTFNPESNEKKLQQMDANTAIQNMGYMTPNQMDKERASREINSLANAEVPAELKEITGTVSGDQELVSGVGKFDQIETGGEGKYDKTELKKGNKTYNSFMDEVKGWFGSERNMLGLALAFNSMRLTPDQGLATVIGKRLEQLNESKVSREAVLQMAQNLLQSARATGNKAEEARIQSIIMGLNSGSDPEDMQKELLKRDPYKGEDKFMESVAVPWYKEMDSTYKGAEQAVRALGKLKQVESILESGKVNTGLFGGILQQIDKFKSAVFGDAGATDSAKKTELIEALLGSDVFAMLKPLGIGARGLDTPAERDFLIKVFTGQITNEEETIKVLTELRRKIFEETIRDHNDKVDSGYYDKLKLLRKGLGKFEIEPYEYKYLPVIEDRYNRTGSSMSGIPATKNNVKPPVKKNNAISGDALG